MTTSLHKTMQDLNETLESNGDIAVLIVDDDPAICRLIQHILTKKFPRAKISVTTDGFAALDMLDFIQPDVIVLDLNMPRMDGFTFCRLLQNGEGARRTPVVAITAQATEETKSLIQDCGARTCLSKPLDLDVLVHEVSAAIENSSANVTGNYQGGRQPQTKNHS